jgi:hypothetical protein
MKTTYEPISITKEEMIEGYKEFINQPELFTTNEINLWKTFVEELELISTDEEFSTWIESKKGWRENITIS